MKSQYCSQPDHTDRVHWGLGNLDNSQDMHRHSVCVFVCVLQIVGSLSLDPAFAFFSSFSTSLRLPEAGGLLLIVVLSSRANFVFGV